MSQIHGGSEAEAKSKIDEIVVKIIKYIESFSSNVETMNGINDASTEELKATMNEEFNTLFPDVSSSTSNSATGALSNLLFWFVYHDYWNTQYGTSYGLIDACTFAYNYNTVMVNHYPEINLAWLRSEDAMYTNETIDSSVIPNNNSGSSKKTIVIHTNTKTTAGNWLVSNGRWWYRHTDGTYTMNAFETINGQTYYFDQEGYMVTGWKNVNGTWYYFTDSGAMYKGWAYLSDSWYYMDADGRMLTGFYDVNGQTYYSDASGAMITGWFLVNDTYYYAYASGAIAKNAWVDGYYVDASGKWISSMPKGEWRRNSVGWWYRHGDGSYAISSFEDINDKTYYFDEDGYMASGWRYINGYWYFFEASGAMVTGWYKVNGTWYYSYSNGKMAVNTTIQGFTVNSDGAWVK